MTLSADGMKGVLDEYESDYHAGMDTKLIADEIRRLTSGYPVLVSYLCSLTHEELLTFIIESSNSNNLYDLWHMGP